MNETQTRPKVSVCIVTYNQEKYIARCLQSILDQVTDFPFEVIVGDDGSKDGTADIVRDFARRFPDRVTAVTRPSNIGPTRNYIDIHNRARGDYVAHLDGDDYCLPGKLARLAAHLDSEPDCRIVWHRMHIINEHGMSAVGMPVAPVSRFIASPRLYARDLAKYYGFTGCHSGSMYRASARKIFSVDDEALDYFFTLSFCIDGGYASYIDEPYGVYRYFSTENTLTRSKGRVLTGQGTLSLMRHYLASNPELGKSFAAQCVFEIMVRAYLRYPLKWEYFRMLLACKSLPLLSDVILVTRMFLANRNASLLRSFQPGTEKGVTA